MATPSRCIPIALDEALALPTDFSARIARNTQLLLQQEAEGTSPT
jgi:methylmalonyl-CoA mutase